MTDPRPRFDNGMEVIEIARDEWSIARHTTTDTTTTVHEEWGPYETHEARHLVTRDDWDARLSLDDFSLTQVQEQLATTETLLAKSDARVAEIASERDIARQELATVHTRILEMGVEVATARSVAEAFRDRNTGLLIAAAKPLQQADFHLPWE